MFSLYIMNYTGSLVGHVWFFRPIGPANQQDCTAHQHACLVLLGWLESQPLAVEVDDGGVADGFDSEGLWIARGKGGSSWKFEIYLRNELEGLWNPWEPLAPHPFCRRNWFEGLFYGTGASQFNSRHWDYTCYVEERSFQPDILTYNDTRQDCEFSKGRGLILFIDGTNCCTVVVENSSRSVRC